MNVTQTGNGHLGKTKTDSANAKKLFDSCDSIRLYSIFNFRRVGKERSQKMIREVAAVIVLSMLRRHCPQ